MTFDQIEELGRRIERLERQNRLLGRFLAVCSIVLLAGLVCGARVYRDSLDIREQLLIRDRNGSVRFDLGVERQQGLSNGLIIYDRDAKRRIVLSVDDNGVGSLGFYDRDGNQIGTYP